MPDWYPEPELERHGLTPDDFNTSGCYVLALDAPTDLAALRDRWGAEYDVAPPAPLVSAVESGHDIIYLGAAKRLCDRLHDHVRGDVRQAGVLAVCPATGVAAVWRTDTPPKS